MKMFLMLAFSLMSFATTAKAVLVVSDIVPNRYYQATAKGNISSVSIKSDGIYIISDEAKLSCFISEKLASDYNLSVQTLFLALSNSSSEKTITIECNFKSGDDSTESGYVSSDNKLHSFSYFSPNKLEEVRLKLDFQD